MEAIELKTHRRTLGLNMKEMALLLETKYRTYQDWESGRRPISGACSSAVKAHVKLDSMLMERIKMNVLKK